MLLKMLPDQISDQWETIWPAIEIVVPANIAGPRARANILHELMNGNMQCWIMKGNDNDDVYALATTCFFNDPSGTRSLFIYSLYGFRPITLEMWTSAFDTLRQWASSLGCVTIMSHTSSAKMIRLTDYLGGDTSNVIAILNVQKNGKLKGVDNGS